MKRWEELLRRLPDEPVVGAEVGVWEGKMAEKLLERPGLTLYMVDRWVPPEEGDSYLTSGAAYALEPKEVYERVYVKAREVAKRFPGRAYILRGDSARTAAQFEDGSLDFVFIDGDHSYQGVARDIAAWRSKVKPGGLLSGHDYDHPKQGAVKDAVTDLIGDVETGANRTWFWRVP